LTDFKNYPLQTLKIVELLMNSLMDFSTTWSMFEMNTLMLILPMNIIDKYFYR